MKAKLVIYPNNEVRLAVFPERLPKDYLKEASESLPESQDETDESNHDLPGKGSDSFSEQCESTFNLKSKVDTVPRKRHLSLSRNGRRQVLRAGSCFDTSEGTKRLLLTGTLPGTGNRAHRALSEFSSYASKTLANWITRRVPKAAWLYCWEFQGRGALHIHFVAEVPVDKVAYITAHFKDEWNRILRAISQKSGVDLYAKTSTYSHAPNKTQADVTECTKEPAKYVSKYISKGSTHAKAFGRFPPRTWYQISRSLLARLRERTEVYEREGLSYRQAREFIEDSLTSVYEGVKAGHRYFTGRCFSWWAYSFGSSSSFQRIKEAMNKATQTLMATQTISLMLKKTLHNYPASRCYMRSAMHSETESLMTKGMLSETEMLLYIEAGMSALATHWQAMRNQTQAAMTLRTCMNWWENKFDYCAYTPECRAEIEKICNNYLTT